MKNEYTITDRHGRTIFPNAHLQDKEYACFNGFVLPFPGPEIAEGRTPSEHAYLHVDEDGDKQDRPIWYSAETIQMYMAITTPAKPTEEVSKTKLRPATDYMELL